ncbi:uncharacterized protein LOC129592626 [Paramacrobiotus metropolitanus]|uniref:uncharacterized protein LOC129592626 n=1 Tax=Paramacrobiotus metropolitanus TaxID=2943436 RepID=UPI0024463F8E|nr:uncharacterized protein LOC129592626 [Paramacrobiotus metropolitanus]
MLVEDMNTTTRAPVRSNFRRIFCASLWPLQLLGFIPWNLEGRVTKRAGKLELCYSVIGVVICLCGWVGVVVSVDTCAVEFQRVKSFFPTTNPIIKATIIATAFFINCRGAAIVTVLLCHRNAWRQLITVFHRNIRIFLDTFSYPLSKLIRLKFMVIGLIIAFLLMSYLWLYSKWLSAKSSMDGFSWLTIQSIGTLELEMVFWHVAIFWMISGLLPYILSQILFVMIIVMAFIQSMIVDRVYRQISLTLDRLRNVCDPDENMIEPVHKIFQSAVKELEQAKTVYHSNVLFCDYFNEHFSRVLLLIYENDCMTVCGNIGTLVAGFSHSEKHLAHVVVRWGSVYAILMFLMHITLCFIPMACIYEQGKCIAAKCHDMKIALEIIKAEHPDAQQTEVRNELASAATVFDREIYYGIGHLFILNKKLIATTLTFLISFAIAIISIVANLTLIAVYRKTSTLREQSVSVTKATGDTNMSNETSGGSMRRRRQNVDEPRQYNARRHFAILTALVLGAVFCWTPINVTYSLMVWNNTFNLQALAATSVIFFLDALLNPLMYPLASKEWRDAFRSLLCCGR